MFKPVERRSLADAVFEQLREEIVSGRMEPGEALPAERLLSDMLGVNRGAVREALKRLEQARLISIQQGGATRVLDFRQTAGTDMLSSLLVRADGSIDTRVARSVLEMRSALASDSARLAARRAGDEDVQQMSALLTQMHANRKRLEVLQELSMTFWKVLVAASENVAYQLAINSLDESYSKFRHVMLQLMAAELTDLPRYEALLEAIQARDEEEAALQARELVRLGESRIGELLTTLDAVTIVPE